MNFIELYLFIYLFIHGTHQVQKCLKIPKPKNRNPIITLIYNKATYRPDLPTSLTSQASEDPPEVVGVSFAADIIRRCRQSILRLRECTTSYTTSCLVPDEKSDTLRDALARSVVGVHPLDGPQAVIRVDPAPGFVSLKNSNALQHLGLSVEVGRVKNTSKNPVAERAVLELEEELLRQEPGGGPVNELSLAIATARLNSRLCSQGLSSRELWIQRNQFSKEKIPINDLQHILAKQKARQANYPFREAAKGGYRPQAPVPPCNLETWFT